MTDGTHSPKPLKPGAQAGEWLRPSYPLARWVLGIAAVLLVAGAVGTIYSMHEAYLVLEPHMPRGAFTIFDLPDTPGGNNLNLYQSNRVFFFHLPCALTAATVSVLMCVGGLLALISRRGHWECLIVAAAQIGIVSCFATMATGYFWGDFAWIGTQGGWNFKDPRLNATLILWLSYIALVLVRAGIDDTAKRRQFTIVYGLITVPLYPLVSNAIEWFGKVVHPLSLSDLLGEGPIQDILRIARPSVIAFFMGFVLLRYWQLRQKEELRVIKGALDSAAEHRT
jgi:hypothetical protein